MASSGVGVDQELVTHFNGMKSGRNCSCFLSVIKDGKFVVAYVSAPYPGVKNARVDEGTCREHFANMKTILLEKAPDGKYHPCVALFDFFVERSDGRMLQKLIGIHWCHDECSTKEKMLFASSKAGFVSKLEGVAKYFQANDPSDLDFEQFKLELIRGAK